MLHIWTVGWLMRLCANRRIFIRMKMESSRFDLWTMLAVTRSPISLNKVLPLDRGILNKFKRSWRETREEQKVQLIGDEECLMDGRLRTLGKPYVLQLAEQVRMRTNESMRPSGSSMRRSAMTSAGLSRDIDGERWLSQLSTQLQQICYSYPENFQGNIPQPPEV